MTIKNSCIQALHDIEMYGGDTTPWRMYLKHDGGTYYTLAEADGYAATLTILPYYMKTGVGVNGVPVLTKTATLKEIDSKAVAEFAMTENDTKTLAGKYIYQVEFAYGSDIRIGQGNLYVHANIDQ